MYCIVPLAGPDFYSESHGIRPLLEHKGRPLIEYAIRSRPWLGNTLKEENIIFVLRNTTGTEKTLEILSNTFPGSRSVVISHLTRGALMSASAGISLIEDHDTPVVLDLADIVYKIDFDIKEFFSDKQNWSGAIPYFKSCNPNYSYLELSGSHVLSTREKEVISSNASAGTYFFRNTPTLLKAIQQAMKNPQTYLTRGNFFVCPAYNALISCGEAVAGIFTRDVEEISLIFK